MRWELLSFFIIGLFELDADTTSTQAADYSKQLAKLSLSYNYAMEMGYFHNPTFRNVLDPLCEVYQKNPSKTIEFVIEDSPISGSFHEGFGEFLKENITPSKDLQKVPYDSKLFKFLTEIWSQTFLTRAIFIFSYGLYDYDYLEHKEVSFDGMIQDVWSHYVNFKKDQNTCYVLNKK